MEFLNPITPAILKIREECEISVDCYLEILDKKYEGWEEMPSILPSDSLVVSELHLQVICFPLHPLYHSIYSIYNLHFLQILPNSLRQIIGFLCLYLIIPLLLQ